MTANKGLEVPFAITSAHLRELRRAAATEWPAAGVITGKGFRKRGKATWRVMMRRLCSEGYFETVDESEFRITAAGRALLEQEKGNNDGVR